MDGCNVTWWASSRIADSLCQWGSGTLKRAWTVFGILVHYTEMSYSECPSIVTQLCHGLWWMKVQEENWNASTNKMGVVLNAWDASGVELCTKWGIHSANLTGIIAFLHWCTQYGHWDWIRACASAICGNSCTAEMWDWCGEHVAQHLQCWMILPHWNAHAVKHETCPSTRRVWLVQPKPLWEIKDMQESNVCLFCNIWLQVVYLMSFVHAQEGSTPLIMAASNGHVEIAQILMDKGANIEATDEVQLVANVY